MPVNFNSSQFLLASSDITNVSVVSFSDLFFILVSSGPSHREKTVPKIPRSDLIVLAVPHPNQGWAAPANPGSSTAPAPPLDS